MSKILPIIFKNSSSGMLNIVNDERSPFSSGGEDGYVRVHYFDPSYFDFRFEF